MRNRAGALSPRRAQTTGFATITWRGLSERQACLPSWKSANPTLPVERRCNSLPLAKESSGP